MEKNIIFWNPWWANEKINVEYRLMYDDINYLINRKEIIFFSGVRRSGKTFYFYYMINKLLEQIKPDNILYLNMDDEILQYIPLSQIFEKYKELFPNLKGKIFLFLDEIQNIDGWERWVKNLYDSNLDIKFFIIRSNSKLLKTKSAKLLTGRVINKVVYPLSFNEILSIKKIGFKNKIDLVKNQSKIKNEFKNYMKYGGFPEVVYEQNERQKILLLKNYFEDIRDKDIISSFSIKEIAKFEKLALYLISNISKLISAKKIGSTINLSTMITNNYMDYAELVYWFLQLKNFSYSIKGQITSRRKIYTIDTGFISAISFMFSENFGRILENVVYLNLIKRDIEIYYHKGNKECDFIIKQGLKIINAIQVSSNLNDEETLKREVDGLLDALQTYNLSEGLILTEDHEQDLVVNGKKIVIKPVWEWLLKG